MNGGEVLVIGGGAIGLAIAIELAHRGMAVTVLSRDFQEAALHAAAGMLAPQAEGLLPGPMLDLCLRSRSLYPSWIQCLEDLTGGDCGYWPSGILVPHYAQTPSTQTPSDGLEGGREPVALAQQWCDRPQIEALQPALSPEVIGGWWFPEDGQVNNQALALVLYEAARRAGVRLQEGVTVERLITQGDRVTGVQTAAGIWQAEQYVLATGAWSGKLLPIPVVPRKGQMLAVQHPQGEQPLRHVLFGRDVYVVPRRSGRVVIGATSEAVGFARHNTPAGVQQLLAAATRLYPPLGDWILEDCWWGFRPATPDELPILGLGPYANLALATGHYRNGILLAPVTAQAIAEGLSTGNFDPLAPAFSWQRFEKAYAAFAP